jgi:hypothetical protein
MGREVRRVPEKWKHPKNENGRYQPMFEGDYKKEFNEWLEEKNQWDNGFQRDWSNGDYKPKEEKYTDMSFEEWHGTAPDSRYYMPQWTEEEKTHLMMYETTSEGTPISPAFKTPEELAHWLYENKASTFGSMTTTYEQWLKMIKGSGWAISAIVENGELKSGVDGL